MSRTEIYEKAAQMKCTVPALNPLAPAYDSRVHIQLKDVTLDRSPKGKEMNKVKNLL